MANMQHPTRFALALLFFFARTPGAQCAGPSVAEQVKAIAQRYEQIEEQLPRAKRYTKREETGDGIVVTQAWFNGVGDLLKVATDRTSPPGRELTEWVPRDPDSPGDGLFVLTRKETSAPDGVTQVEETRRYYGRLSSRTPEGEATDSGVLIRELKKSARFAPGEPLDTSKIPNTTVDIPKPTEEATASAEDEKVRSKLFDEPGPIAFGMQQAGAPEADPTASVPGDSDRFRLVHGTASPDGRYAIAIGFEQPVDWSQYADHEFDEADVYTAEYNDDLRNYVIDLTTQRILGTTGGSYFGTRSSYNHRSCTVSWTNDSATFVQQFSEKWRYIDCHAGRIGPGPKLVGTVDLGKQAEKHAQTFLKSKGRKYLGSIGLTVESVEPDGTIKLEVYGQSPSVPNRGEIFFRVQETFRLRETPRRLHLQFVKARLLPND